MILAGKCPPEKDEIEFIEEKTDFENIELYIERKHLENYEKTVGNLKASGLNVVSVHTPHVPLSEEEYFHKADELAQEFDAFLVFHTNKAMLSEIEDMEDLDLKSDLGYENNPGDSYRFLKSMILDQDRDMVLDTAHIFMSDKNYLETIGEMLSEYSDQIPLIHICDSTLEEDGVGFGEGVMDMEKVSKTISDSEFDGILVFEVMPEFQQDALEKWREWS